MVTQLFYLSLFQSTFKMCMENNKQKFGNRGNSNQNLKSGRVAIQKIPIRLSASIANVA